MILFDRLRSDVDIILGVQHGQQHVAALTEAKRTETDSYTICKRDLTAAEEYLQDLVKPQMSRLRHFC